MGRDPEEHVALCGNGLSVPDDMQDHCSGEGGRGGEGDLINHFYLPVREREGEALPVTRRAHTVMVWDSLLCVVPLALPSSEPLLWKTWTHPPLPPRPRGPQLVSVCVEVVGGPCGNPVTA